MEDYLDDEHPGSTSMSSSHFLQIVWGEVHETLHTTTVGIVEHLIELGVGRAGRGTKRGK